MNGSIYLRLVHYEVNQKGKRRYDNISFLLSLLLLFRHLYRSLSLVQFSIDMVYKQQSHALRLYQVCNIRRGGGEGTVLVRPNKIRFSLLLPFLFLFTKAGFSRTLSIAHKLHPFIFHLRLSLSSINSSFFPTFLSPFPLK